jgi:hypothetical protein
MSGTLALNFVDLFWEKLDDSVPPSRQPTSMGELDLVRSPAPFYATFESPAESLYRLSSQQTDSAEAGRTPA